jgi:hypothetical protein
MRLLVLVPVLMMAGDLGPAALAVDSTCADYADTHTLVRKDVLKKLNASDKNLPSCEAGLTQAQADLVQAKTDLIALQKAAIEQRAVIAEYKAQKQVLEGHITKLEGIVCPEPTVGDQIAQGWEEVDGVVGLGAGYALGTGMCIGIAYVFNQPAFTR